MNLLDRRRQTPRIRTSSLCGVVTGDALDHATMLDLSVSGMRLERPFDPARAGASGSRVVQLEIELPGYDEVVWAKAEVAFARLVPVGRRADGEPRFVCRAGLRIANMCRREQQALRAFVVDELQARHAVDERRTERRRV